MTDRAIALRVVTALRAGSNCLEGVELFSAGRQKIIKAAADIFDEIELSDGSVVRWIRGRTGQGKTHLFARLIGIAHAKNWVTSYIQVSDRGQGTELHRFEEIYAAIVRNCLCRQMVVDQQGRVEPGVISGWEWILEEWWSGIRRLAVGHDGGDTQTFRIQAVIDQSITAMRRKWSLHGSFAEALRQYARSRADGEEEWAETIRAWFKGDNVHGQSPEIRKRLRSAGIVESVSRRNAKEMLRSITVFLRYRGYSGLLMLLDELENVLHQPPAPRRTAYTILRELIDNLDDRHGMKRAAIYISATPDVFDSEQGLTTYEALAARVLPPGPRTTRNPAGSIIDLGVWPLEETDFADMAVKVQHLHGVAHSWDPGSEVSDHLEVLRKAELKKNPDMTARTWIRAVVDALDSARQERETK